MPILSILLLVLIIGDYFLETLSSVLNQGALTSQIPAEFEGVFDSEKYRKMMDYQRAKARLGNIRRTFFAAFLIFFIFTGCFEVLDEAVRSFTGSSSEIVLGLFFTGTYVVIRFVLQLPFSIYDTFVIEEKFGFNRTTIRTFIGDIVKGVIVGGILGGLSLAGLIFFFDRTGERAWIYAWIAFTIFQIFLIFIAPVVLLPLFNKFKPLTDGPLKSAIDQYAAKEGFALQGIFTMDASKRSTKSNAFFTGFGRFRRLVLFDTLIERQSIDELLAVVAHEVGHFKRKHILKFLLISVLSTGITFYALSLLIRNPALFQVFGVEHLSIYASMLFLSIFYSPLSAIFGIFNNALSRKFEFQADDFSVQTFGKPLELISALKKLSVESFSHLTPHPLKVLLDYTHPPVLQRIRHLRELA